ncbi:hypothetical protein NL529_31760, partial [Klebsiella pneumoniae]|nr:hypothetical protein [Klebsiella pneumoniae]
SMVISGSKVGNDTFTITDMPTITTQIKGDLGNDTLVAPDAVNAWKVVGKNAGTLGNRVSFLGVENLTGGSLADTFVVGLGSGVS